MNAASIKISDAEFARVRTLAMQLAGINIAPAKKMMVASRWAQRLSHYGLSNFGEYLAMLSERDAAEELQISLDLLTTNETSFFREPPHFELLRKLVIARPTGAAGFRAWSAACSSGEEAYSIAMVLASCAPPISWSVLATDISTRVLATAAAGIYEQDRVRPIPADYLHRFCLKGTGPETGRFLVSRELRSRVSFKHANLNQIIPGSGAFDVIFLRNVLIYFDTATKARVIDHLVPALRPGGTLIIGHCDSLAGLAHGLETRGPSVFEKPLN
jgi:chemotaxis protein methyltransferase CheR